MKNESLLNLATRAAETVKRFGANDARIKVRRNRYIYLERNQRQLGQIEEASSMSLGATLFVNGRYASHSTSDLRPESLDAFLKNAVQLTSLLEADPSRSLPDPSLYADFQERDLKLADTAYETTDTPWRKSVVQQLEDIAATTGGDALDQIESYYYDSQGESALVNTNGFQGTEKATIFWAGIALTVPDGQSKKSYHEGGGTRYKADMPKLEALSKTALDRVLAMRKAAPMKTQNLPMIVENKVVGQMLRHLMAPMSASSIQQKQSFLEAMKGQSIAGKALTLIDDPFVEGGLGSTPFDGEGIPSHRRIMIDQGVLKEFYIDSYYGKKLGWKPNGGSSSNLTFALGDRGLDDFMKDVPKALWVTGFLGGNSNSTTGDFSLGINGFYVENGEIVKPVQEMNIAGNHLEFWKKLVAVGNDPYPYSSVQAPTFFFDDVLFSGL